MVSFLLLLKVLAAGLYFLIITVVLSAILIVISRHYKALGYRLDVIHNIVLGGCVLYLLALGLLCNFHIFPRSLWWLANLIQVLPLWMLGIPSLMAIAYGISCRRIYVVIAHVLCLGIIFFGLMGWNFSLSKWFGQKTNMTVRVVTANIGARANVYHLGKYFNQIEPDIVVLQEASEGAREILKNALEGDWNFLFQDGFGLASRYKIVSSREQSRKDFGGSGGIIAQYSLACPGGPINFFNVHLETPREGVESVLYDSLAGIGEMKLVTQTQEKESHIAYEWVSREEKVLVAGDFNMLGINPIFQEYWSGYQDAFSKGGTGFGYTKYTGLNGVRIDHILADQNWQVADAQVGPDIGGDHRPVFAELILIGQPRRPHVEFDPVASGDAPSSLKSDVKSLLKHMRSRWAND